MITYVKGIISEIYLDHIVVENNGLGYLIYFNKSDLVSEGQEMCIYTFQKVSEDALDLFGFLTKEELNFFLRLLKVKGIGAKSAMNIMTNTNLTSLIQAIEVSDVDYLRSINGIGEKSAAQIILDLKGKFNFDDKNVNENILTNVEESLKSLGYRRTEIQKIAKELRQSNESSEQAILKQALQLLAAKRS